MSDLTDNLRIMARNFYREASDAAEWRDKRENGTAQYLVESAKICNEAAAELERLTGEKP